MKIKVDKYDYVKTLIKGVIIDVPEKQFAFREDRHTVILVTPKWTTWNIENGKESEEVYELRIIEVSSHAPEIKVVNLSMIPTSVESTLIGMARVTSYSLRQTVLNKIMNYPEDDLVSIENFKSHYDGVLTEINENYITT